jgi:hypothetical protein
VVVDGLLHQVLYLQVLYLQLRERYLVVRRGVLNPQLNIDEAVVALRLCEKAAWSGVVLALAHHSLVQPSITELVWLDEVGLSWCG